MTSIADLDIFTQVAAAGSMTAVGRKLNLSPANISKRISSLEFTLGASLFHRTTRQLRLTEAGSGFYQRVVLILNDIREAEAFLLSGHKHVGGVLKVAAPAAFGRLHIAPHLRIFMKKYPDVSVEIIATDQADVIRDSIDVAIQIGEMAGNMFLGAKMLAPCRRVFCASPAYLKENETPKTLSDLSYHKVVAENNAAWRLQGPDGVVSLKLSSELKTNSSEIVHQAVACGCGVGFLSTWEIRDDLLARKLVPILPQYREEPGVAIYAVYGAKHSIPAKLRVFMEFLEAAYGPTPYWDEEFTPQKMAA